MNRRDIFIKWLFYSAATLLFVLIQGLILNRLSLWDGVHPFILPMLAVIPVLLERHGGGLMFALVLGFLCDLVLPAPMPVTYTLSFLVSALLTVLIAGRLQAGFPSALLCCALSLLLCDVLQYLTVPQQMIPPLPALGILGREMALSLPFSPLIFWLDRLIYRRMLDV